ncbi:MAG: hypothetical protein E6K63_12775 [Nitrospirae bacterium]|nr:MAG: hypothetical protein E6K63_12775 [Nitrospirota bacterium]
MRIAFLLGVLIGGCTAGSKPPSSPEAQKPAGQWQEVAASDLAQQSGVAEAESREVESRGLPPITVTPLFMPLQVLTEKFQMPVPCEGRQSCWLSRRGTGSLSETFSYFSNFGAARCSDEYYLSCQREFHDTLDAFKSRNGFGAGQPEVRATYFNNIDLRIGRDMHCLRNGDRVACYVSNYGPPAFLNGGANPAYPDPHAALTEAVVAAGGVFASVTIQQQPVGSLGTAQAFKNLPPSVGSPGPLPIPKPLATVAMEFGPAPSPKTVIVRERDGLFTQTNYGVCPFTSNDGPPSRQDVDTGIDVRPGDVIEFSATGSIWAGVCLTAQNGPKGWDYATNDRKFPVRGVPPFGLIGRIGQPNDTAAYPSVDFACDRGCGSHPSYFYIGDSRPYTANGSGGRLYLRTNDDTPGNGTGFFQVTITVRRDAKFYVYDQNGKLIPSVALDREGPKFVPQMCLACHGGYYNAETHTVRGASFLPFDVFNFLYSESPGFRLADQEVKFRDLNLLVQSTNPSRDNPNRPIQRMIEGMYRGPTGIVNQTAVRYIPVGWRGHEDLYRDFVGKYCRLCHMAQAPRIDFETYDNFKQSAPTAAICRFGTMPHAQGPYGHLETGRFSSQVGDELRALGVSCINKS